LPVICATNLMAVAISTQKIATATDFVLGSRSRRVLG
jgi:hypothetical protein